MAATSQKGQRVRGALVLGALVVLVSGVALVGAGNSAQAAGTLCQSVSSGTGSASITIANCTSGFSDGDDVTITGAGFPANQNVTIIMCSADPTSTNDCDQSGGDTGPAPADASGNIDETFTVSQTFTTEGGTDVTCNNGSPSPNCSILVVNGVPTTGTGAYEDVPFGAPATTTTTGGSTTTTTGGGSTTTTSSTGSTTSTTSAPATCPTGGPTTSPSVSVSPLQTTPGSDVTVSGAGFTAGTPVNINLCSTPITLKTAVIDANGNLVATVVSIPASAALGTHQIVVQPSNGSTTAGVGSITLVSGAVTPTPAATAVPAEPTFTG